MSFPNSKKRNALPYPAFIHCHLAADVPFDVAVAITDITLHRLADSLRTTRRPDLDPVACMLLEARHTVCHAITLLKKNNPE